MKHFAFLTILLMTFMSSYAQPQITWRFANPEIIRQGTSDRLEFDLQVKASENGTFLFSGQYNLTFNNDAFYTSSLNTTVIRSGISNQFSDDLGDYKYTITRNNTGVEPNMVINVALTPSEVAILPEEPSSAWSAEITTEWQTFTRLRIRIANPSLLAGITFIEAFMNGQISYHSGPMSITEYLSPNLYETLNLNLLNLGRIYSETYGWSQVGAAQFDWNTPANTTIFDGNATITQANNTAALANNLNIMGGASLTLETNKWLTAAGTLNTPGSDALIINDRGSLIHNSSAVEATLKRNITGGSLNATTHRYHLVSVPMDVSNAYTAGDIFTGIHLWELDAINQDWSKISDVNYPINNQEGYLIWHDQPSRSLEISGTLNGSDYNLPTKNLGTYTDGESYRLLPNPYPSAMEWSTPTGYDAAVYFYNGATGNYVTFADGVPSPAIIPAGQSFFVKTTVPATTANTITIRNNSRLHSGQTLYKSVNNISNLLQIKVSSEISEDDAYIRFHEEATNLFDADKDARKLNGFGDAPQLFTSLEGINYAINTLEMTSEPIAVPLHFTMSMDGMVNMEIARLESFTQGGSVFLEDLYLNEMVDVTAQSVYSFQHHQNIPADRFKLHFNGMVGTETIASENIKMYVLNKRIYIHSPLSESGNASVEIFDQLGRTVYHQINASDNPIVINAANYPHFLIVKVKTASHAKTSKLIIQ